MTVAELIAKLQEFPQDLPVMFAGERDYVEIESVDRGAMYDNDNFVVVLNYDWGTEAKLNGVSES